MFVSGLVVVEHDIDDGNVKWKKKKNMKKMIQPSPNRQKYIIIFVCISHNTIVLSTCCATCVCCLFTFVVGFLFFHFFQLSLIALHCVDLFLNERDSHMCPQWKLYSRNKSSNFRMDNDEKNPGILQLIQVSA